MRGMTFTHAVIVYEDGSDFVSDRWCYCTLAAASSALEAWEAKGFEGEPEGWHRHPFSGRRREDGDPARERVSA